MDAAGCAKYEDYRGVMIDIALEDTSLDEPALVDEVRRHIRACPCCQREFNAYQRVVTLFTPPPASDEEIDEIAANVRRRVLAKVAASERRRRLLRWSALVAGGVVAMATVVLISWPVSRLSPSQAKTSCAPLIRGSKAAAVAAPANGPDHQRGPAEKGTGSPTIAPAQKSMPAIPPGGGTQQHVARVNTLPCGKGAPSSVASKQREGPELERHRRLARVAGVMSFIQEPLRGNSQNEAAVAHAKQAIADARALAAEAPGTTEARKARYFAFRYLQLIGEHEEAESEFGTYVDETLAAEGKGAACKVLDQEGCREMRDKNYLLAVKRFEAMAGIAQDDGVAATAHARIGNIYNCLGNHERAVVEMRTALRMGVGTSDARDCYQYLVCSALCRKEYEQALSDAKKLIALPTNQAAQAFDRALLGRVMEHTDGLVKAAQWYREILRSFPEAYCSEAKRRLKAIEQSFEADIVPASK